MLRNHILNIAAWLPVTRVLGPGRRFALWVQGCPFSCSGCMAPAWRIRKRREVHSVHKVAQWIDDTPDLEGITLSGGEPMLQASALCVLIDHIRRSRELTVIAYTGFDLYALQSSKSTARRSLMERVDVLIHGPYKEEQNDNKGLRGSSNQKISFFTQVYAHLEQEFIEAERQVELHVYNSGLLTSGIYPQGFASDLKTALELQSSYSSFNTDAV